MLVQLPKHSGQLFEVTDLADEWQYLDDEQKDTLYGRYCAAAVCSLCIDCPSSFRTIRADGSERVKKIIRN